MANELAQKNESELPESNVVTPMSMLQSAREQGASIEQMQQLMDIQFKWESNEARKAFMQAIADFKYSPIEVKKDKKNKQYGSRYASKGNLVNTVNAKLSKHGLNASWDIDQHENGVTVTCILSHSQGHSERVSMSAPPDTSGSKNPIQQIKSTITYLKKETYESVTGVAPSDDPYDDDGNSAGTATIDINQAEQLEKLIAEKDADKEAFLYHFGIEKLEQLPVNRFQTAIKMLKAKK